MSGSVIHSQSAVMVPAVYSAGQPASLPVAIDYPAALALRQMSMIHDELLKYLLAPEVSALLHYVPDLRLCLLVAGTRRKKRVRNIPLNNGIINSIDCVEIAYPYI